MEYCIEFTLCDLLYFVLLADQSVEEKEINLIYDKIFQNGLCTPRYSGGQGYIASAIYDIQP